MKVKNTNVAFEVTVDDKPCFASSKVKSRFSLFLFFFFFFFSPECENCVNGTTQIILPSGYTFGLTAATPENPDSFEVFKFLVNREQTTSPAQTQQPVQQPPSTQQPAPPPQQQAPPQQQPTGNEIPSLSEAMELQLHDIHKRILDIEKSHLKLAEYLERNHAESEVKYAQLTEMISTRQQQANVEARLDRIDQSVANIMRELQGRDYNRHFNQLHDTLKKSHLSLTEDMYDSKYTWQWPGLFFFFLGVRH